MIARAADESAAAWPAWLEPLVACPACGGDVLRRDDALACVSGHRVPIVDGVARFTPRSSYADSFGFEWTRFSTEQLDRDDRRESEEALAEKTGLGPGDVAGKTVLDAGCGMGRFSDVLARWGARVVGADLTRAVDAAARNVPDRDAAAFVQADLRRLPFRPGSFDVVMSIGVLHHTPRTRTAFERLAPLVRPGGVLAVWVYSRTLQVALLGGELIRPITRRMGPERLLSVVETVTPRMWSLKQRMPGPSSRIVDAVLPTSNHPDPRWRALDTFDWYSPRYQWKHTYAEVERWFRSVGFVDIRRLPVPVSVRGTAPGGRAR